ncbi:MAG: hypothetical protein HQK65_20970 [Desulfamplus sp.]|nr:hypothetical protein [Desulfamplus sp.]
MLQIKKILYSTIIFSFVYTICLIIWIQVKPYYGMIMTRTGSECAALFSDFSLDDFKHDSENARISYSRVIYTPKGLADLNIELNIKVSNYSFNIPLTIALVAVLFYMLKWYSRTMTEIIVLILLTHFCFIFFYTSLYLFYYSHPEKIPSLTTIFKQYFLEFMSAFIGNMLIQFEPFLIALYIVFKKSHILSEKNLSINWFASKQHGN